MEKSLLKLWTSLGLALLLSLALHGLALAENPTPPPGPLNIPPVPPPSEEPLLSLPAYARVITGNVPVYQHPQHAADGLSPVRALDAGYVWVTLANSQQVQHAEAAWYLINPNEYVRADYLEVYQPSTFRGIIRPGSETFAWMVFDAWTAANPGQLPDEATVLLKRYTVVPILEAEVVEDRFWYRVGENQWVEQGMVGMVQPKSRPDGIPAGDKWIEIDLYEQTLAAYEGDELVYATLVSSGLPWWRTEPGLFQVWVKVRQGKMSGRAGYPDYYFLEDVPWTMYFNGSFALHGAYWHDRFGIRHSHGCVNLAPADAKWLFEWATPVGDTGWIPASEENAGTWVWVHE